MASPSAKGQTEISNQTNMEGGGRGESSSDAEAALQYEPTPLRPTLANRLRRYASLAVSRNPSESMKLERRRHQEQLLLTTRRTDDEEGRGERTTHRLRSGVRDVVAAVNLREDAEAAQNAAAAGRLPADVVLENRMKDHPHKKALIRAYTKKAKNEYRGWADRLSNELFLLGQRIFDLLTPKQLNEHNVWFTVTFMTVLLVTFWYMAAENPRYEQSRGVANVPEFFGSKGLVRWMSKSGGNYEFKTDFLILWGARDALKMEDGAEFWRWFSSLVVHQDFQHLMNNLVLYVLFSTHLEIKYGTWRIALLTLLAGLGGNFLSASFEDPCIVVVGASGCCFGLLGLFVADMALNFETVSFPILRGLFIIVMVILNLYTVLTTEDTSHISHLGGFLAGMFPSFIFLPNLKWEKYEASFPYLGAITLLLFFIALPLYIYFGVLPDMGSCTGSR